MPHSPMIGMHKTNTQSAAFLPLQPVYEQRFRCIGAECEDTCCAGWTIPIDKASYEKYQLLPASALRTKVEQHLLLTPEKNSDAYYASIQHDSRGFCPFLEESLCGLQKKHGPEYLSHTCANYPRSSRQIDGLTEKTLLLSCPEAARLVLLEQNLVPELSAAPVDGLRYGQFHHLSAEPAGAGDLPMVYFWQIRSFALLLLRDRSYPLWQRLFLLGVFCKRLSGLVGERQIHLIPKLLEDYSKIVSDLLLGATMEAIAAQPALQLDILLTLLKNRLERSPVNGRLLECVRDFSLGIGFDPASTPAALLSRYLGANTRYFRPWFVQNELLFENYLSNYVFAHLFPFGSPGPEQGLHIYREYMLLCVHYAMIKGLLIGIAGRYQSAFDTACALKLIQSLAKDIEHSAQSVEQIVDFLETSHLDNTNGMTVLLRDSAQPGM
ncbi:flagellin lysine-N-methylase [Acidipila rosea]|nr:flagellin lysine-N-methylase [Acidipila rosea]